MARIEFQPERKQAGPCQFCGTDGCVVVMPFLRSLAPKKGYQVSCCQCLLRGPAKDTEAEAIEAWNSIRLGRDPALHPGGK